MHGQGKQRKGDRGRVAEATQRTTGRLDAAHGLQDQIGQRTPSPAEIVAPAAGARRAHGSLVASVDRILTVADVAALLAKLTNLLASELKTASGSSDSIEGRG